jgi:aminopeptidase N
VAYPGGHSDVLYHFLSYNSICALEYPANKTISSRRFWPARSIHSFTVGRWITTMKRRGVRKLSWFWLAIFFVLPKVLIATGQPRPVTPSHYAIAIVPDFDKNTLEGDESIDIHLTEATASIELNAAEITFEDATITNGRITQPAQVAVDKKKELAILSVKSAFEPGDVTAHIHYRGIIRDSCCGFYRINAGKYRYGLMYSSARTVFPSFDDPTAKATFDIATTVDASDGAISNGRLISDTPNSTQTFHTLRFATTARISTYLVTIAIGQFECQTGSVDGIQIRVCGPPYLKGLGSSALEAAKFTLHFYDQYFETKYPYGKLDFVGLPDIPGAMETVACILADASSLFGGGPGDGQSNSLWSKNMAIGPVAHEMAHQWLGDLVTPSSDEDGWLSEGMATWMQYKSAAAWRPDWEVEMEQQLRTYSAMQVDSLSNTPAVRSLDAPDPIKYDKAAAILRMMEAYVGEETFRRGINSYVARYAYKNASGDQLWSEIAKASGMPVDRIAEGFITEPGVPVLTLTSKCLRAKTEVSLQQERFLSNPSNGKAIEGNPWQIPVCLKLNGKTHCELLGSSGHGYVLDGCGPVFANSGATGYYQSNYDATNLDALTTVAESSLSPEERLALLNNVWAEMRVGHESVGPFLSLIARLDRDQDPVVLRLMGNDLAYLRDYIVEDSDQVQFATWVRKTFATRAEAVIQNRGTSFTDTQSELLKITGNIGRDPEVVGFTQKVTTDALSDKGGNLGLGSIAFEIASANGEDSLYDKIQGRFASSKNPRERIEYIQLLALFEGPQQIQSTLAMLTSTSLSESEARALRSLIFRNRIARPMAWKFLAKNWEDVQHRGLLSLGLFDDLSQFCDEGARVEIQRFFTDHPVPEFKQPLERALAGIKACADVRSIQQPQLKDWIGKQAIFAPSKQSKMGLG